MPVDHNIYFQQQAPDLMGGVENGMRLRDMLDQRKYKQQELAQQQAVKDAYRAGIVTNPDGTTSLDQGRTLSALAAASPQEYHAFKSKMDAEKSATFDRKMKEVDLIGQVVGDIRDQSSYDKALGFLSSQGMDISGIPKQYDPVLVSRYAQASERWNAQKRHQDELAARSADRAEARAERRFNAGVKMGESYRKEIDDKAIRLNDALQPHQETLTSFDTIDEQLGFQLDNFDPTTGKAKMLDPQTGKMVEKAIDLPGVSIPGIGRIPGFGKGRTLQDTADKLFNITLKDRSGAAVTTPEMERLRAEFSTGKWNTEEEMLAGMQRYKAATAAAMRNIQAGYNPDVVATLKNRGARLAPEGGSVAGRGPVRTEKNQPSNPFQTPSANAGQRQTFKTNEIDWAD